ncbi:GNAT family N-acetyltransferase [bacterium]|nr:MAG: GNAT family N-acetyltransferase [bacterium]
MKSLIGRFPFFPSARAKTADAPSSHSPATTRIWATPVLRWVGTDSTIAIRSFDWENDADFICSWQRETYAINFPDFKLSLEFSGAFRHDLRRAFLDGNHALWMLEDANGAPCGFIWVVLCTNSWTNERYGYVNNLFIESSYRGLHLGEDLLEHAAGWFRSRKVEKLRLTVTGSNASAVRLYERAGFTVERLEMERDL